MRPRPHACPAALAFMAAGRHDPRPALVALYYADDDTGLQTILRYGAGYLAKWCERRALLYPEDATRAAVAHGLLRLWRPCDAGATDSRAREVRMRAEPFRLLSNAARDLFRHRLTEGAAAFVQVAAGSELPRPAGTLLSPYTPETWWRPGRPAECRLVEWKIGSTSPPDIPRAPPRETGWLPSFDWAA